LLEQFFRTKENVWIKISLLKMRNIKSVYLIVAISLTIGLLHFIIGPNYQGFLKDLINGYLIDLLLPLSIYLLFQIALRKFLTIIKSRIIGALTTFIIGLTVEILQLNDIPVFGSTYDPLDIVMYTIGVLLGLLIDVTIIDKLERSTNKFEL